MWYVILGEDTPGSLPRRLATRAAHLERLEALKAEDRLLTAGPLPHIDSDNPAQAGFYGSLIIAQFDCIADAYIWANSDPYVHENVYAQVKIFPYKLVF